MATKTYIGSPCSMCQGTKRYVSTGNCISCALKASKNYKEKHPEEHHRWEKAHPQEAKASNGARCRRWLAIEGNRRSRFYYGIKYNYGLIADQFDRMIIELCGTCSFCGKQFSNSRGDPAVDHDHKTGAVRGLLHGSCNLAIGRLGDTSESLQKAIDYLRSVRYS